MNPEIWTYAAEKKTSRNKESPTAVVNVYLRLHLECPDYWTEFETK